MYGRIELDSNKLKFSLLSDTTKFTRQLTHWLFMTVVCFEN